MALANSENILRLLFSYNLWWQTGSVQKEFNKPMKRFAYQEAMNSEANRYTSIGCPLWRT